MANSLLTGISGLRSHQKMLEVVGNNLANLNTTSFKSSRVLFSDMMYEVQRGSSSGSSGSTGSVNPIEVGTGSRVSQTDLNLQQGNFESTGRSLDLGVDGAGYFVAKSGNDTYFTRDGAFSLDAHGYLTDTSTGNLIQRYGNAGEPDGVNPAFQTPNDNRIYIPIGASLPGKITQSVELTGNLSSTATGLVAQRLITSHALQTGGIAASLSTALNDLDNNTTDYNTGDKLIIKGSKSNGSAPDSTELVLDPLTTVGDLIAELNTAFPDATVSLDSSGNIVATANTAGPSSLNILIEDGLSNVGNSDFQKTAMVLTNKGKIPDTYSRTTQVYDANGAAHSIGLEFTKQIDGTWNMQASISPTDGTLLDSEVTGIRFQVDGSFDRVTGTGLGDAGITLELYGQAAPQTVNLTFGTPGTMDGLTQLGIQSRIQPDVDGFPPGTLSDVQVDSTGTIKGLISNGQQLVLGQLAIAAFRNPDGLMSVGNNSYQASLASGEPELGEAESGARGAIRSGQLEGSNVDLAVEFTRLIIAQRGFSANARTITVTDQVLQELTNLIR